MLRDNATIGERLDVAARSVEMIETNLDQIRKDPACTDAARQLLTAAEVFAAALTTTLVHVANTVEDPEAPSKGSQQGWQGQARRAGQRRHPTSKACLRP